MNWKSLYVGALRRPDTLDTLVRHGLGAVRSSANVDLRNKVFANTATPFKLCAMLDAFDVPVPLDAEREISDRLDA
jgi:hypothetical protein